MILSQRTLRQPPPEHRAPDNRACRTTSPTDVSHWWQGRSGLPEAVHRPGMQRPGRGHGRYFWLQLRQPQREPTHSRNAATAVSAPEATETTNQARSAAPTCRGTTCRRRSRLRPCATQPVRCLGNVQTRSINDRRRRPAYRQPNGRRIEGGGEIRRTGADRWAFITKAVRRMASLAVAR